MDEPPVITQARSGSRFFVVWVLLAGLVAFLFTALLVFFFFQSRPAASGPVPAARVRTLALSKLSFTDIPENSIAGRYKFTDGTNESFLVLYDDHSFMNKDGTSFSQYRWDIAADSLSLQWMSGSSRFTNVEASGVYSCITKKGIARLEKLPPYTPSQLVPPKPVASIRLGGQSQTNGLTPANTGGGDGEILPGSVGGVECYQLVRQENRPAGYLYLKIAPELKDPPFTNALVIVEYFDAASPDGGRRSLTVQYDAQHGVYANVQPLYLDGSDRWQEATFYLPRPNFQSLENSGADFRICAGASDLFVRSVKLVKNTILPEWKMPTSTAVK